MELEIQPGRGIGTLTFGCRRDEVSETLGQPERIEENEDSMGERCIAWHYESKGLSFYFDEDADFRLGVIDAGALEVAVLGIRPVGLEVDEAVAAFEKLGGLVPDEELEGAGRAAYDLGSEFVTLWFQDGLCESIQAFVPLDAADEYLWPAEGPT
jgi:hypothetical protein